MEAIAQKAGLQIRHVPYKAAVNMFVDLMGGVLDVAWAPIALGLPLVTAGKIKAVAVSGPYHVPQLPSIKTMTEQGVRSTQLLGLLLLRRLIHRNLSLTD